MIHTTILILHIVAGTLALLAGAVAIFSQKGKTVHRSGGKLFVATMTITALAAIGLSLLNPNMFLLAIGFFTLYLTFSGWIWALRMTQAKKVSLNYLIGSFGLLSALLLLYKAFTVSNRVNIILLVFAGIQLSMALVDLLKKLAIRKNTSRHISKIGGAYIAATTAFLVVNNSFLPPILAWLAPSLIGTVFIILAIRKNEGLKGNN
jgi:uncharacterized membrane protein